MQLLKKLDINKYPCIYTVYIYISISLCVRQILPLPVHPPRPGQPAHHGGPHGELRGHPDELPGVGRHQATADQSHAEEAVQGNHDVTGEASCSSHSGESLTTESETVSCSGGSR